MHITRSTQFPWRLCALWVHPTTLSRVLIHHSISRNWWLWFKIMNLLLTQLDLPNLNLLHTEFYISTNRIPTTFKRVAYISTFPFFVEPTDSTKVVSFTGQILSLWDKIQTKFNVSYLLQQFWFCLTDQLQNFQEAVLETQLSGIFWLLKIL